MASAIYLDHAATTPMLPEVIETITKSMQDSYGNASSIHRMGRDARKQLDHARSMLAETIRADARDIVFTSGGTEANNLALTGYARANKENGKHIITSAVEHHAVLHPLEKLKEEGFDVTCLPVDQTGAVSLDQLKAAFREDTILVSIMHSNNETGVLQPVEDIAAYVKNTQAAMHTDAVQSYGLSNLDVEKLGVDMLSVSAHKINGPKGTGFLYIRRGMLVDPLHAGGEQERRKRAGTENVPGAAGFAKAAEEKTLSREQAAADLLSLKKHFLSRLEEEAVSFAVNGEVSRTQPHIVNIYLPGVQMESFLVQLDMEGIYASSGSACTAGSMQPSHVIEAMYPGEERAYSSIRFSFGVGNTLEEMNKTAAVIGKILKRS